MPSVAACTGQMEMNIGSAREMGLEDASAQQLNALASMSCKQLCTDGLRAMNGGNVKVNVGLGAGKDRGEVNTNMGVHAGDGKAGGSMKVGAGGVNMEVGVEVEE